MPPLGGGAPSPTIPLQSARKSRPTMAPLGNFVDSDDDDEDKEASEAFLDALKKIQSKSKGEGRKKAEENARRKIRAKKRDFEEMSGNLVEKHKKKWANKSKAFHAKVNILRKKYEEHQREVQLLQASIAEKIKKLNESSKAMEKELEEIENERAEMLYGAASQEWVKNEMERARALIKEKTEVKIYTNDTHILYPFDS